MMPSTLLFSPVFYFILEHSFAFISLPLSRSLVAPIFMASSGINHYTHPCTEGRSSVAAGKSRFLKWLGKLFGSGPHRGTSGGRRREILEDEGMIWRDPDTPLNDHSIENGENEELDCAIALSLSEDEKRRAHGHKRPTDEDLARELQDSLNSSSYPPFPPTEYPMGGYRYCAGCNREIVYGTYLAFMGSHFHPECFRCRSCGNQISEHQFSLSGRNMYHKSCFKELMHPKCEVCHQFMPTNEAGLIEYRCHPYWSQKYCPRHEHVTPRCCSCERLESPHAKYICLGDGRRLCLECMESSIMDTGDCQPLYLAIKDFYEGLNMKLEQQIPMLLVERQALNEAIVGEKNGHIHMPETRGLCLSEEQTVTSIEKRPKIGGGRLLGMRTQPRKLTRRCEVTAILVLYGLPRLLTGAILAHELMHAWLRLKGYSNLNPSVEEGICQVLSYMWLESEVIPLPKATASSSTTSATLFSNTKKGMKSVVENKLGEFFLYQIANDVSLTYGAGFRDAHAAVCKYGLRYTLNSIRTIGEFPP